jgi:hypothetical protein
MRFVLMATTRRCAAPGSSSRAVSRRQPTRVLT